MNEEIRYKGDHNYEYIFDKTKEGWLSIIYTRYPIEIHDEKAINARMIEIPPECMYSFKEILFTDKKVAITEFRIQDNTPIEFKTVKLKENVYNIRKESDGSMVIYWINSLIPPYSPRKDVIGYKNPLHIQHVVIDKGALDKLREFVKNVFVSE